jgi:hypothetical protein
MKKAIYGLLIVLTILHQDFWLWYNNSLIFGFLPIGLAYHVMYTIAVAIVWALLVKFAWPKDFLVTLAQRDEKNL